MTVVVNDRRKEYPGNGVATVFNGPLAYRPTDIQVYLVEDATNVSTPVPGSGYTLDRIGRPAGTRVTMVVAPPSGQTLLILRTVPYSQDVDITNQGDFNAQIVETADDLLEMQIQQLADNQSRSLQLPDTAIGSDFSTILPFPEPLTLLGWDQGSPFHIRNFQISELVTVAAFSNFRAEPFTALAGQNVFNLAESPGPAANLTVTVDGLVQTPGVDYTLSGNVVTMAAGLLVGQEVLARYGQALPVGVGSSDGITYLAPATGAEARALTDRLGEVKYSKDFGAVGDGVADDTSKLAKAFLWLAQNGGHLIINGIHKISSSLSPGNFAKDALIEFEEGAKLVAAAGMNTPVMNLFASASVPTTRRIRVVNPTVDTSAGNSPGGGGQFCTGLALTFFGDVRVYDGFMYGGETPTNTNADSGITTVGCTNVLINETRFRGFNDCAIYLNGDSSAGPGAGDGVYAGVIGCVFERCNNPINSKREFAHVEVMGGSVTECVSGFTCVEVSSPFLNPGRRMDVKDVRFKKVTANMVRYRGNATGTVSDNVFEDWGRTYDGVSSVGANAYAMQLEGTSGLQVSDNDFRRVDWALDDQRAYLLNDITLNAVPFTQGKNAFNGNTYRNIARIVVQAAAGNPNFFYDETYDTISGTKFNSLNTSTVVQYREVGSQQQWFVLNGVVSPAGPRRQLDVPAGATLTAADSGNTYTNVGATALAIFNLPDVGQGVEFSFYSMDTDGVQLKAAAGDIIRIAGSASTAGGTATCTQVGTFIKLRRLDSTNWVAEAAHGTWTLA